MSNQKNLKKMQESMIDVEPEIIHELTIEDIWPKAKSEILRVLAKHSKKLVPLESIPNASPSLMDDLLKEGLIGVERLKGGHINCIITTRGRRFVQKHIRKNNP
jgi:hypothetical protein